MDSLESGKSEKTYDEYVVNLITDSEEETHEQCVERVRTGFEVESEVYLTRSLFGWDMKDENPPLDSLPCVCNIGIYGKETGNSTSPS
jgi:hypothetical protein